MHENRRIILFILIAGLIFLPLFLFGWGISPPVVSAEGHKEFVVKTGDGFRSVSSALETMKLIRSSVAFDLYAIGSGAAFRMKPGKYSFSADMSAKEILDILQVGVVEEVEVVVPEGSSVYSVDKVMSDAGVIKKGELISFARISDFSVEGYLFPDTYRFYAPSKPEDVVARMKNNFIEKASKILAADPAESVRNLILASILEREVPDHNERKVVAGLLKKRLAAGMPLQVDATICYAKQIDAGEAVPCGELTKADLAMESPYNTYINRGYPPGPIGSPGESAISAAVSPEKSPYWFYLSDPNTKKTIFSKDLDEHTRNRVKYLINSSN